MNVPTKRRGRPLRFDSAKRGQFCALVRAGCSLKHAAKHTGIHVGTVYYACRTDPAFDAQLRTAEQERDRNRLPRPNNAWRSGEPGRVSPPMNPSTGERNSVSPPIDPDQPDDDPAVEAAAQAAYERLLALLNG
jgi:hypothetical protein